MAIIAPNENQVQCNKEATLNRAYSRNPTKFGQISPPFSNHSRQSGVNARPQAAS